MIASKKGSRKDFKIESTTVVQTQKKGSSRRRENAPQKDQSGYSPAVRPTMLLVLGMHRSGTSVTTRLLECLGAVNSTRLMPPVSENNEKGFFEDLDIYHFNEGKLLPHLKLSWHSLAFVDWSQLPTPTRSKFALEALEIIRRNYSAANPLSILKEPRIGILLPFWLSVLRHAGYNVQVVCAVRDPASVARSLAKRDGFSITQAGMLYVTNWISILSHIQDLPVAFVQFDEIFSNPARVARMVADQLRLPVPGDFESRLHSFSSTFFDSSLRHSSLEKRDLPLETDLPPLAISIYESLLAAAQSQNIKKTAKLVAYAEEMLACVKPVFTDFDRIFQDLTGSRHGNSANEVELQQLKAALREAQANPGETRLLLEKEAMMRGQLAERLTALDAEKQRLALELDTATSQIAEAQREAATQAAERAELTASNTALVTERDSLSARLSPLDAEHSSLATRHQQLAAERDTMASERGQLAERLTALDAEKQRLALELDTATSQIAEAQREAATQAAERAELTASNTALVTERDSLSARLSPLDAEHSSLATRHQQLAAERDTMASERGQLAERLTALDAEKQRLALELDTATSQIAEAQREAATQAAGRAELTTSHSALATERDALSTRLSALDAEHSQLATRHQQLAAERDTLASERGQLAERLTALDAEKQRLSLELESATSQIAEAQREAATQAAGRAELTTSHSALLTERDTLSNQVRTLESNVQERFEELAKISKMLLAAQDSLASERGQLAERFTALDAEKQRLSLELDTATNRIAEAQHEAATQAAGREDLAKDLGDRFEEIALLSKRLLEVEADGDQRVAAIQARINAMQARITWKLGAPARWVWDKTRNAAFKLIHLPTAWSILRLHRHSGLFNHEWYCAQNPDVTAATSRPFLHFAFCGVFEGRPPNPFYNESEYLKRVPAADLRGLPPLLHYVLKGHFEKNSSSRNH
jgi:chromosome segregation ATPase